MKSLIERFEEKVFPEPNSGCWIWMGALDEHRYARIKVEDKNKKASRVSLGIYKCEPPDQVNSLHRCDVRECVNPDHLFEGSHQDNMRDRDQKGRGFDSSGERNPNAKLTWDDVALIRSSSSPAKEMAERFGVSGTLIYRIRKNEAWVEKETVH